MNLSIVGVKDAGWATVRNRLHSLMKEIEPKTDLFPIERYETRYKWVRQTSLRHALAGRKAFLQAINRGADRVLFFTFQYAPLLSSKHAGKILLYGDSTNDQMVQLGYSQSRLPEYLRKLHPLRMRILAERGSTFLCMSKMLCRSLEKEVFLPAEKIVYFPSAIDTSLYRPRSVPRPTEDGINILFIGSEMERKGGRTLQSLFGESSLAGVRWTTITGREKFVDAPSNVSQLDNVPADSVGLADVYRSADIFLLPTQADLSPNVLIEASSTALPCISTKVGAIDELVIDRKTGLLSESGNYHQLLDNLNTLVGNRDLRVKMGLSARQHVLDNFDLASAKLKLCEILSPG